jgi:light-regulated signal transduction histidine kinase (bacteriophytochrome)
VDLSGEPHILAFVQDITERKKAEAEAKKQAEELQRSNADLEQFAYVASHDLREPLRTVSNYVSLLERRYAAKLDDDAREFIAYARDGAKRMNNLILSLLEYSRIGRSGQPSAKLQLNEVVEQACASLQKSIDETGAIIEVSELPQVTGCAEELQRMFENLIGNAIKYRKPDSQLGIKISAERDGSYWAVKVADNGIGIDPEYFKRIFEIFKRLHRETEYEGTGIGLASCKKIVEQHGGRIWVESQPDNGSVFIFTLPALS